MSLHLDLDVTRVPSYLLFDKKINGKPARTKGFAKAAGGIGNSKNATGIEIRMLPPLVKNNRTDKIFPFPGFAKLYCVTIVVSDLPNQSVGGIDLKGFPRIGDNEALPINKTVFYWQGGGNTDKAPDQIHFISQVMKSKKGLRDTGSILEGLKDNKEYNTVVEQLGNLLKNAGNFNPITQGLTALSGIVGKLLKEVEDKPLGAVIQSYTTLRGDFDNLGVNRHLYTTPNVDFTFELIVRDASVHPHSSGKKGVAKASGTQAQEQVDVDMVPLK